MPVAKVLEFIDMADRSVDLGGTRGGYDTDQEKLDMLNTLVDLNTALILYLNRTDVQDIIGNEGTLHELTKKFELRNLILKEIADDVEK